MTEQHGHTRRGAMFAWQTAPHWLRIRFTVGCQAAVKNKIASLLSRHIDGADKSISEPLAWRAELRIRIELLYFRFKFHFTVHVNLYPKHDCIQTFFFIFWARKEMYKSFLTLKSIQFFASWTLLKWSHRLTCGGHIFRFYSQFYVYYTTLLLLLLFLRGNVLHHL